MVMVAVERGSNEGSEVDSMVMVAVERGCNEGSEEVDSRVWTWRRKRSRNERMCCSKKKVILVIIWRSMGFLI